MSLTWMVVGVLAWSLLLPGCGDEPPPRAHEITVAVAASMADVVGEAVAAWEATWGDESGRFPAPTVRLMSGSSATLARQIEQGAPVDLFVSASVEWMDQLEAAGRLVPGIRGVLAGNRLVWARPAGERATVTAEVAASRDGATDAPASWHADAPGEGESPAPPPSASTSTDVAPGSSSWHAGALPPAVAALLSDPAARWTTGDPTHVPLGRYGKQALDAAGAWPGLAPRLVPAADARAALRLVERGEVAVGLLYASDAHGNDAVEVVAEVPAATHDPIVYPAALVAPGRMTASALLFWLTIDEAAALFAARGFDVSVRSRSPDVDAVAGEAGRTSGSAHAAAGSAAASRPVDPGRAPGADAAPDASADTTDEGGGVNVPAPVTPAAGDH